MQTSMDVLHAQLCKFSLLILLLHVLAIKDHLTAV